MNIVVIGLDGASWNILMSLIRKSKLPTMKYLIENGCYGYLESCIPPISVPAWKCYSTGKNPDKLKVYDFLIFDLKNKTYKAPRSQDFNGKDLWYYLGIKGYVSCIYKMFSTHPASKINGCMVSDVPNEKGFYPKKLKDELERKFGELFFEFKYIEDRENTYFRAIKEIERDFNIVKYLISEYNPNFVHISISHTDGIQHFFWKDMVERDQKYGKFIENAWMEVDKQLNNFIKFLYNKYGDNLYIFIISDHDFTEVKYRFNIGKWLVDMRYIRLTNIGKIMKFISFFLRDVERAMKILEKIINFLRRILKRREQRKGVQFQLIVGGLYKKVIDWEKSKVLPLDGQVLYINNKHFKNKKEKEKFVKDVIENISKIKRPDGESLVEYIYYGKEIYKNDENSPDIIILPKNVFLYNAPLLNVLWSEPSKKQWTGMHDLYGIFIALGKGIKKGRKIENARIVDIAPTILHIFGLPIPNDMDGRVLTEIFEPDSEFAKRKPQYVDLNYYERLSEKQKIKQRIMKIKRIKHEKA